MSQHTFYVSSLCWVVCHAVLLGIPAFPTQYLSKVGHFAFVTAFFWMDLPFQPHVISNHLDLSMYPSVRFPVPGIKKAVTNAKWPTFEKCCVGKAENPSRTA